MNDPFFMGCGQPMRDLQGVVQSLTHRDRPAAQATPQRLSLQQLRHYVRRAFMRANVEYRKDVGMVQGSGGEGLSLKAVGVTRKRRRQDFDRYFAFETRVAAW